MIHPPEADGPLRPDLRRMHALEAIGLLVIAANVWLLDRFVAPTHHVQQILLVIALVGVAVLLVAVWPGRIPRRLLALSITAQCLGVTAGIHYGGGPDQVSGTLLYGLLVGLAGVALSGRAAFGTASLAAALYGTMVLLEHRGILPHLVSFSRPVERQIAGVIGVATYLHLLAWLVSYTQRELRTARHAARRFRLEALRARSVTVLFSDVVGSTELTERLGDAVAQRVLAEHARTVRGLLARHAGLEIQRQGDGFLVWFPSPRAAVDYAVALHRELTGRGARSPEQAVAVRVGIHAGPVIPEEGTFFGKTVIVACRIAAQAEADEILISEAVRPPVAAAGITFDGSRVLSLKGLSEPYRVYAVDWRSAREPATAAARSEPVLGTA